MSDTARAASAPPSAEGRQIPGEPGIWVLALGDLVVFALFFGAIVVFRGEHTEVFARSQHQLHHTLGMVNTILLVTGSLLVALGIKAARAGAPATRVIVLALVCGTSFIVVKAGEYTSLVRDGHTPEQNDFFMYYFVFTGIHLMHLVVGLGALVFIIHLARRPVRTEQQTKLMESCGVYWHLVDVLWLGLFALLYLVH